MRNSLYIFLFLTFSQTWNKASKLDKRGINHSLIKEISFMLTLSDICFLQRENNTFMVNICRLLKNHQSYLCIIS